MRTNKMCGLIIYGNFARMDMERFKGKATTLISLFVIKRIYQLIF